MRQLKLTGRITIRESESIEKYLTEISKIDLISQEEEVALAKKIKAGDIDALQKLVSANLRFVVSVAKQYTTPFLSLNDLINEGNLGLVKAAQKYDETRGFKFISYAVWWIRQSIMQALAEQGRIVRIPLNKVGMRNKINKILDKLEQEYEREPTNEELNAVLKITEKEIQLLKSTFKLHESIDAPVDGIHGQGEEQKWEFMPGDEKPTDHGTTQDSLKIEINRMLDCFRKKHEREVVEYFFGLNGKHAMRLDSIAEKLGLTKERVRQIKDSALRQLQGSPRFNAGKLKEYLGT